MTKTSQKLSRAGLHLKEEESPHKATKLRLNVSVEFFYWNFGLHSNVFHFNFDLCFHYPLSSGLANDEAFLTLEASSCYGSPDVWTENSGRAAQASGAGELEKSKKKKVLVDL